MAEKKKDRDVYLYKEGEIRGFIRGNCKYRKKDIKKED